MDTLPNQLPVMLLAFVMLVVVFPLLRFRWRTGRSALVVRASGGPVERFVRAWLVTLSAALGVWSVLVKTVGTARLGIWPVPAPVSALGAALVALGALLVVIAQAQMGKSWRIGIDDAPTALVTSGLYRHIRHPIYTGILTALAGLACIAPGAFSAGAWLLMYFLVAIQCRLEDGHMAHQHGAGFFSWAAHTGRLLPGLGRLRSSGARQA